MQHKVYRYCKNSLTWSFMIEKHMKFNQSLQNNKKQKNQNKHSISYR